ncbi:MAG: small multi-drug export protein [Proteobacteria bacterium]|nr:small multi-drug export protein [Pseudomonadota bacterium]
MIKTFNKLAVVTNNALKKLIFLIRKRIDLIEVKILLIGIILTVLAALYLGYLFFADFHLYSILSLTAVIHIMGGRALGIAKCLSAGISPFVTISYNFFLEIVIVLITYGMFVLIMRNVIQPKLFKSAVRQAELTAQSQKTRIKKYGTIGLFLFVMFPFFMTGPVIGAIIGYLLNYRAINTFLIVFSGTLSSIIIYTFLGNSAISYINQFVDIELIKKWATIISVVLIVIFLIYHMKTIKNYLNNLEDDD